MTMRFPALILAFLAAASTLAVPAHAGSQANPELMDPTDANLDYWTDGTKALVNEANGTLELWTEFRAATSSDLTSLHTTFDRQTDASFELTFGFTANGKSWRAMLTTQENTPPGGVPPPVRVPGNEGQSTFKLLDGDHVDINDVSTGTTHRFTATNPSGTPASQLAMRLPEYLTYFPRGTTFTDLWETMVVYAPQAYDKVAYKPCPGIVNQGLDKVTQCIKGGSATYAVGGGTRLQLDQLQWRLDPGNATAQPSDTLYGQATATNENTDHRSEEHTSELQSRLHIE